MRLMRTASSPSLISISAMPDSSSSSISFFTLRISMRAPEEGGSSGRGEARGSGTQGKFIAQRPETDDLADGDVREIRVAAECLARVHVRQVHFDERQSDAEDGIAQGDAGVRECAGVQDQEGGALGG